MMSGTTDATDAADAELSRAAVGELVNPLGPVDRVLRDLRSRRDGLSQREAERRLVVFGPNELRRPHRRRLGRGLGRQFTHPLAVLVWAGAGVAVFNPPPVFGGAVRGVLVV